MYSVIDRVIFCTHCRDEIERGTPAVFNFATGEAWHATCPNPMGGVNAALDDLKAQEKGKPDA
jgi:hypothetical protein